MYEKLRELNVDKLLNLYFLSEIFHIISKHRLNKCLLSLRIISVCKKKRKTNNKKTTNNTLWEKTGSVHNSFSSPDNVSTICAWFEQEVWFTCRMTLVNQTLGYRKQHDDIKKGGEKGRGWPRFPRRAGERAFMASAREVFPLLWKTIKKNPNKTFLKATK